MPYYVGGDQTFYRAVYENISTKDGLISTFLYYSSGLGATEIVHFLLISISSELGFDKDVVMSVFNSFLFFFAYKLCRRLGAYKLVSFLVVISNYYLYVFAFSAERLKFGFIFLFALLLFKSRVYLYLSLFSHFQMGLVFIAVVASKISDPFVKLFVYAKIRKENLLYLFFFISLLSLVVAFSNIIQKIYIYIETSDFTIYSLLKILLLFLIAMISMSSKSRRVALPQLIFLLLTSVLFGTDRIFVVMYFVAMYFCIQYNRGLNLFVFLTVTYYSVSTFRFLSNILLYGDGFNL